MNRGSVAYERPPVPIAGFNEAPIHESGKLPPDARQRPRIRASMRPRFMNRGSELHHRWTARAGRGFNEAPIHESGKSISPTCAA